MIRRTPGAGSNNTASASGSGLPSNVLSKTSAFTAASGDFVQCDTTSAGFTITLPTAPATGALVAVKKVSGDTNTLTIAAAGGGTIDGSATFTTVTQWAGVILEHVGSNVWRVAVSMSTTGPAGTNGTNGTNGVISGVQDEGVDLTARSKINFVGSGVTAADSGSVTTVTIPGGGSSVVGQIPRKLRAGGLWVTTGGGSVGTLSPSAGYEYTFPFEVFESTTFTNIGINVVAVNTTAVIRLGVRADSSGAPGTLVAEAATTIDASSGTGTTGDKSLAFAQTLAAGVYWLSLIAQGGSPQVKATNSLPVVISATTTAGQMQNALCGYANDGSTTSGAIPSSWGSTYAQQVTVPRICLKTT